VARELGIEQRGNGLLAALGWLQVKVGFEGWPDRLVIWAPGRHLWWEAKRPDGGRLTPAQKNRIKQLRESGEDVFIGAEFVELLELLI
jgi:hypothetical protein